MAAQAPSGAAWFTAVCCQRICDPAQVNWRARDCGGFNSPWIACSPGPGSPASSARSAPRSASPRAAFRPCANNPGASGPAAGAAQQRDRRHQPASPQRPGSNRPRTASTAGRPSPTWAWGSAAAAPPPPGAAPATRRPSTPWNAPTAPSARPGARSQKSVRWVTRPRCPIPRTLPQENQQVRSPCQVWNPSWSSSSTSGSFMDRATRVRLVDHHCVAGLQLAQSLA